MHEYQRDRGYVYWDGATSGDEYNSANSYDYAYMMANVRCPVHNRTGMCRCVDPKINSHMPGTRPGEWTQFTIVDPDFTLDHRP